MMDAYIGEVRTFAFGYVPTGWVLCNGQTLKIAAYGLLYSILGTTYGGDGKTTFAVPNLQVSTNSASGSGASMGYTVMTFCICTTGYYPTQP